MRVQDALDTAFAPSQDCEADEGWPLQGERRGLNARDRTIDVRKLFVLRQCADVLVLHPSWHAGVHQLQRHRVVAQVEARAQHGLQRHDAVDGAVEGRLVVSKS